MSNRDELLLYLQDYRMHFESMQWPNQFFTHELNRENIKSVQRVGRTLLKIQLHSPAVTQHTKLTGLSSHELDEIIEFLKVEASQTLPILETLANKQKELLVAISFILSMGCIPYFEESMDEVRLSVKKYNRDTDETIYPFYIALSRNDLTTSWVVYKFAGYKDIAIVLGNLFDSDVVDPNDILLKKNIEL